MIRSTYLLTTECSSKFNKLLTLKIYLTTTALYSEGAYTGN